MIHFAIHVTVTVIRQNHSSTTSFARFAYLEIDELSRFIVASGVMVSNDLFPWPGFNN